ncbi:hypothetical protein SAMN05444008_1018 [Cnuella takakiae]|uniref:Replication-associated protein ORF2/G2P domain-containing protein n=1 Tax=Cnuella takakiae TaxID=1302690 RepID=A0A1M4S817_9BACT|nr:hypothetical protein [Cnuella takakiae]OLY94409.1 hypothetical protein BUE76_22900 [Cnuella takakiae]SHE28353.1 hypothetical protein SAMN05444008_1018 [Cnuella takakiae]
MLVSKNTFGVSCVVVAPQTVHADKIGGFGGSSLERKTYPKKVKSLVEELLEKPLLSTPEEKKAPKLRTMSPRTKSKIRKKIISFARINKRLSFLTLTFCNAVEDQKAVKVLGDFLENAGKRMDDFQYLWVAEKQTENKVFKDNIHFHLITNKMWKIKKWWPYWLELQKRHGIVPREEGYKPTSAFNVKAVQTGNIRGLVKYLTSYVTKNEGQFGCQVWNCSKKISHLYTEFYSGMEFIHQLRSLEAQGLLGGAIKTFSKEWCNVHLIPLNRTTSPFYNKIDQKNKEVWGKEEKEVEDASK